jgi:hypothetical protein
MAERKFDRSQLKGTALNVIDEQNKSISSNSSKKRDYVQIEEGTNKFRIFPAHPDTDEKNRYAQPKYVSWLPYYKKDEEGNVTDKLSNRPFLNARVHANQELDIVEEYIKAATKVIQSDSSLTTKEKGEKIKSLSDFQKGIKPQGKFVCYAKKEGTDDRGLLELSYGIKKKLDAISLAEYEEDPSAPDVISDPNEGYIVTIKYDKSKPNNEKYSVQLGRKVSEISDEDLDWWFEEDSLTYILHESVVYNQGTISRALESLKIYDELNDFNVYDSPEFQDVADELKSVLPEVDGDDDTESADDAPKASSKKKKKLGEMTKAELKEWILDEDLDIRVMKRDTEEDVLEAINVETGLTADDYPDVDSIGSEDDTPFEEDEDEVEDTTEEEVEEAAEEEAPKSRRTRRTRSRG